MTNRPTTMPTIPGRSRGIQGGIPALSRAALRVVIGGEVTRYELPVTRQNGHRLPVVSYQSPVAPHPPAPPPPGVACGAGPRPPTQGPRHPAPGPYPRLMRTGIEATVVAAL